MAVYIGREKFTLASASGFITQFSVVVVESLPQLGQNMVIYLIKQEGETNIYDQYVWESESISFKLIGSTSINLNDFYKKSEVDTLLVNKQGTLTAGTNITIDENNVISATGGGSSSATYDATTKTIKFS